MQMGPDNKPGVHSTPPAVELERGALEPYTVNATDPFSRYILHYGIKALTHAALAHRALEAIENSSDGRSTNLEIFKVRLNPLSFTLGGLQASGVIVPTAAMTTSTVFWNQHQPTPDRVEFAHPDLLNPIIAYPGSMNRAAIPRSFFQQEWVEGDLLDRMKMGATLLVAERIWESCVGLLRRRVVNEEILVGAVENLVHYYSGYLTQLMVGESRQESLAMGETFLNRLLSHDEEVAARILEESRLAALAAESLALEGTLPPAPPEKSGKRVPRRKKITPSSLSAEELAEEANLTKLRALRGLIHDPHPANRVEGMALLRQWQGPLSSRVEAELNQTLKQAARIELWLARIEAGLLTFERGDTAEGIRLVREVASRTHIPVIKDEARALLKTFGHVLTTLGRKDRATDEWPKPGAQRRLVDVVRTAYLHGSDAEVICHDGLKRSGRLCFGGIAPTSLKLLDFKHEITWNIDLTSIRSIKLFHDKDRTNPGESKPEK